MWFSVHLLRGHSSPKICAILVYGHGHRVVLILMNVSIIFKKCENGLFEHQTPFLQILQIQTSHLSEFGEAYFWS